jgi:hypothetical protein
METKELGIPVDLCQDLNAHLMNVVYDKADTVEVTEAVYDIFNDRVTLQRTDRNIKVVVQRGFYRNSTKDVYPTNLFYIEAGEDVEEIITNYYFQ